jgi:hypothetical protein
MHRPTERWLKGLRDAMLSRESKLNDMLGKLRQLETIEQQLLSAIADAKLAKVEDKLAEFEGRERLRLEQAELDTKISQRKCASHSHHGRVFTPR